MGFKRFIRDHEMLMKFLAAIYRFFGWNRGFHKRGIKITRSGVFCKKTVIVNKGRNNRLVLGKGCRIKHCKIAFYGNDNEIYIDRDCVMTNMDICVGDGGCIKVGHNTHFTGSIHIACVEGRTVEVGATCLFSSEIVIRTSDSHVITDLEDNRINPGADVVIGEHTWVGQRVIILKGATISENTIVGGGSVVTGKTFEGNSVLAGNPAKVVKREVTWRPK